MAGDRWSDRECYRALLSRDGRFDGEFFACVTSTGIYCRPVCPAKKPKFEHCVFVPSAAAAEEMGFRPCFRCRPETAPGSPAWLGTESTVARALRCLSEAASDGGSIERVAERLGITDRHLRRLFHEQLGASPKAVVQTERFHLARQLLVHTDLGVAQVAFSSGFQSVRRFNDAVKAAFGLTPSRYRVNARKSGNDRVSHHIRLWLGYRAPLRWENLLAYLAMRAIPGVEQVDGNRYVRPVKLEGAQGMLCVARPKPGDPARHQIRVDLALDRPIHLSKAVRRVRDLFDLDAVTDRVEEQLARDPRLGRMVKARPGLRIPGCWDVFELAVRAVVGQQVSLRAAGTLLARLVRSYGRPLTLSQPDREGPPIAGIEPAYLFPDPRDLKNADLTSIGLTRSRARAVSSLARAFADDVSFVDGATSLPEAVDRLRSIHGVGEWTAEYIALRALRHPDAFPASDLGLLKAIGTDKPAALRRRAEAWRPWRGYAALHLWTDLAARTGTV